MEKVKVVIGDCIFVVEQMKVFQGRHTKHQTRHE